LNRIEPANLHWDAQGIPWSPRYGDIYHSADSGPGQARHVFLGGNDLPERWRARDRFTILETGFGLGINFLATWKAWRDDPERCHRLFYVSVEKHPFNRTDLENIHAAYSEFTDLARTLLEAWPLPLPGVHRVELEGGRLCLMLVGGEANALLPQLSFSADAIYLDGFSPAKNPEMWSPSLLKAVSRKAAIGATLATYTSASAVRHTLEREGFICEKVPGFGRKREMLRARYAPRWTPRHLRVASDSSRPALTFERHAMVIGAGLAGAAVAERLVARGWRITLIDQAGSPAQGASSLRAGAFHPHLSKDDCLLSRLSRHAFLRSLVRWQALERDGHALAWARCGLIERPHRPNEEAEMAQTLERLGFPPEYAQFVDTPRASEIAGAAMAGGGWWIPHGGWMRAPTLVRALLAACGESLDVRFGETVASIAWSGNGLSTWRAQRGDGSLIAEAPALILANAHGVQRLADIGTRLKAIGGRLSFFPVPPGAEPRVVISGMGYAIPQQEAGILAGSTYEIEDAPPLDEASANAANRTRLAQLLPGIRLHEHEGPMSEYAHRAVAIDRMPLMGAVPNVEAARANAASLAGAPLGALPRLPGLYCATGFGSRGLTWSTLAGELLASQMEGDPLPLERDLADAIDPGRFLLRSLRRGHP
jgi:tRNA 5-methylaminomethyl-2-thiouridine biosynthesis bifunctional protein